MSKAMVRISLVNAVMFGLAVAALAAQNQATVTESQGTLAGRVDAHGVRSFKGIPYAAPPVGDKRWTAPVAAGPWKGMRDASDFGASCYETSYSPQSLFYIPQPKLSEDCLFLNVWTPPHAKKAPVILWVHGGGFVRGGSWEPQYEGTHFAEHGVVFVSINYRLGSLGWFALPELSAESPHGVSGNYGLLDQIEALKWVKKNIAAFGGDPGNVTIDGESAGGVSMALLMVSPLARGLFQKVISESMGIQSAPELKQRNHGLPSAEELGAAFEKALGAADLKALRAIDPKTVTEHAGFRGGPNVDGWVVPDQFVNIFDRKQEALVPVLIGFNRNEIYPVLMPLGPRGLPASSDDYEAEIRKRYSDLAPEFLRLYPGSDMLESGRAAHRDAIFGWSAMRIVRDEAKAGMPSYLYFFDHAYPAADARGFRAFHGSEMPYTFGHVGKEAVLPPNWPLPDGPKEQSLSDAMISYWTSFARTGVPKAPGEPDWPTYAPNKSYMYFGETPQPSTDLMPGMFELQEEIVDRARKAGDQPWVGNVGVAPPVPSTPAATR
ncbi:MAG TPA: carboxylesterase family protein [Candidatus Sulfotelmatobacter sp.]|jgi:para-nitrobenzyl esterase